MKPMKDRKMDMRAGEPDSDGYFPSKPEMKAMPRAGEVRGFKYPDTEQAIHRDQNQAIAATNRALPKPEFRH